MCGPSREQIPIRSADVPEIWDKLLHIHEPDEERVELKRCADISIGR